MDECTPANHYDPKAPLHPDSHAPGRAGQFTIPPEYRTLNGWTLEPHNAIRENVTDFWTRSATDAWIRYTATRHGTPIEDVALCGRNRDGDTYHWTLKRENLLGTASTISADDGSGYVSTTGTVNDALTMLRDWTADNPARTADSVFVPVRLPDGASVATRFRKHFTGVSDAGDGRLVDEGEVAAYLPSEDSTIPERDVSLTAFTAPIRGVVEREFGDFDSTYIGFSDGKNIECWLTPGSWGRLQTLLRNRGASEDEQTQYIKDHARIHRPTGILAVEVCDGEYVVLAPNALHQRDDVEVCSPSRAEV